MTDSLRVPIVGGGLTGLIVARELRDQGIAVTLFDTRSPSAAGSTPRPSPSPGSVPSPSILAVSASAAQPVAPRPLGPDHGGSPTPR